MKSYAPQQTATLGSSSSTSAALSSGLFSGLGNAALASQLPATESETAASGFDFGGLSAWSGLDEEAGDTASQEAPVLATLDSAGMLRRGDEGEQVRILQTLLNTLSGAGLAVDGDFGLNTHRAVRAYQAANALSPDGIVGPNTKAKLNAGATAPTTATGGKDTGDTTTGGGDTGEDSATVDSGDAAQVTGSPMLVSGMRGPQVEALQRLLNAAGASLLVDGDYGTLTRNAVMAFQRANGLEVDGKVGPKTAGSLTSGSAKDLSEGSFEGTEGYDSLRDAVIDAAASHLGAPYSWGADGPTMFDCSGFVLYVLRQDTGLVDWGDDTAAGIKGRLPGTGSPMKGDPVFYTGSSGTSHIEFYTGSGSRTIGASGGGSSTYGDNPNAKVQYGDYTRDSRSKSFGSIQSLIERKGAAST